LKPFQYFLNLKVFQMLFLVPAGIRKNCLCSCSPSPSKLVLRGAQGKAGTRVAPHLPGRTEQKQPEYVCIRPERLDTHQSGQSMRTRQKTPSKLAQGVLDRHLPVNHQSVFISPPAAPA